MTELWELLSLELGASFKNQYGTSEDPAFRHWCRELAEFSQEEIKSAFFAFKNSGQTYMCLNTFRSFCKPAELHERLSLPDFETSFKATIFGKWGALPEAFQVVFGEHRYDLRKLSEDAARKRFKKIYDSTVKRIAGGEIIRKPEVPQLASPSVTVHTRRQCGPTGKEAMQGLLAMMGSSKANV